MAMKREAKTGQGDDHPQTWLLYGPDPRFFEEPAGAWTRRWGGEEGAVSFPAPGLTPAAFHTEVNSLPFLKERQVLRLTHLEGASKDLLDAVAAYCANPCPTTALLLEYQGSPPSADKRGRRGTGEEASGPPAILVLFAAVPHRGCQPPAVRGYVTQRLREAGFRANPGALDAIEEWAARDVSRAAAALDLLLLYRAGEGILCEEDVAALLGAGGSPTRWQLSDAFMARDGRKFRLLLRQVESDPEIQREGSGGAIAFAGMIAKQVRALLISRGAIDSGASSQEAVALLGRDPLKMKDYAAAKVLGALPKWPEAEIRGVLETLFRLDLALKGGAEPGPPWTLVERYLAPAASPT